MTFIHLFILATVQALTEFIPVSSSGHLIALSEVFKIESILAFDVVLHVGTLTALIIYYRSTVARVISSIFGGNRHLLKMILISSVPAGIAGLLLGDILGDARQLNIVIIMLILVGLIMVFEDKLLPKKATKKTEELTAVDALLIGTAQSLALIPGTSRSGSSIIGGRLIGLDNKDSADYSFIIGIPIIAVAALKTLLEQDSLDYISANTSDVLIGLVITTVFGLLAIDIVLKLLKKVGLKWFGIYRIVLAIILIIIV